MSGSHKFYFGDNISIGVRDLQRAIDWYQEKLDLRLTPLKSEEFDAFLAPSANDKVGLALVRIAVGESEADVEKHPILFTKKIEECRAQFLARGVQAGPIQQDSGGNSFFLFHDAEANTIEVCVEP
jgi:catechol 2,3-dioxygenase-like lactoylglutathione lyase family enzyme